MVSVFLSDYDLPVRLQSTLHARSNTVSPSRSGLTLQLITRSIFCNRNKIKMVRIESP